MSFEERQLPNFDLIDNAVSNFCKNQHGYDEMSKDEKQFYYLVNYSRNNPKKFFDSVIVPIVSIYPQLKGVYLSSLASDVSEVTSLPLLKLNPILIKMAKDHSIDITSHDDGPSHNSSNGDTFSDRFKNNLLKKCGGENISYGSDDPTFLLTLLYLDVDVPSLGHRKALLNPNFVETGIGDSFFKDGTVFFVEDFACSQN